MTKWDAFVIIAGIIVLLIIMSPFIILSIGLVLGHIGQ